MRWERETARTGRDGARDVGWQTARDRASGCAARCQPVECPVRVGGEVVRRWTPTREYAPDEGAGAAGSTIASFGGSTGAASWVRQSSPVTGTITGTPSVAGGFSFGAGSPAATAAATPPSTGGGFSFGGAPSATAATAAATPLSTGGGNYLWDVLREEGVPEDDLQQLQDLGWKDFGITNKLGSRETSL